MLPETPRTETGEAEEELPLITLNDVLGHPGYPQRLSCLARDSNEKSGSSWVEKALPHLLVSRGIKMPR